MILDQAITAWPNAARYRSAGVWPDRLIIDDLDAHTTDRPDLLAVVDARRSMTYAQLRDDSYRVAAGLLERGVQSGDRVAIQLPNWLEYLVLHCALVRIGAITCLITPMSRGREVQGMLRIASANWLVIPRAFRGFDYLGMARELCTNFPSLQLIVLEEHEHAQTRETINDADVHLWEQIAKKPCDIASQQAIDRMKPNPDDITEVVFTSGTTGDPKGVMHTSNTLYAPQLAMAQSLNLGVGCVLHMASTLGHQTGFLNGVRLPIQVGGTIVLQDVWKPETFVELIAKHQIEVSSGSATFLMDLLKAKNLDQYDLSSLRVFRAGGGPIPVALVKDAETRLTKLKVLRGWGQTENGVVTLTRLDDTVEVRAQTDGYVQPGMEIRIVDESQRQVNFGIEGCVQVRGAFMSPNYANSPELMSTYYHDGWFDTGDLAVMDEREYIRITGRLKDIVIRGGENIPVHYVENVLFEDPRVMEVSIVGMPDERLGEKCCAFVIPTEGWKLTLKMMQDFLASKDVAVQFWPERLELVDNLPRTANGKVQKATLRSWLQASSTAFK